MSKWDKLLMRISNLSKDIRFDELVLVMHDFDYRLDRIRGSHAYFIHSKHPNICVPKHEPIKVAYI